MLDHIQHYNDYKERKHYSVYFVLLNVYDLRAFYYCFSTFCTWYNSECNYGTLWSKCLHWSYLLGNHKWCWKTIWTILFLDFIKDGFNAKSFEHSFVHQMKPGICLCLCRRESYLIDICYLCFFFGGKAKIRIGFSELKEEHQISVLDLVLHLCKNLLIAPSCTEKRC